MRTFLILCSLLLTIAACNPKNKIENGTKTIYYPRSKQVQQTVEYKNGKKNGYLTEYFKDGRLKAKQFYANDSLDDTTWIYHESGQLKTLRLYKNKKRHGCWKDYNKAGKLYSETCFKDDLLDSVSTRSGVRTNRLQMRVEYKEGVKHGVEEYFYASGKLRSRQTYNHGQPLPGAEEYYENGKKVGNDFSIGVTEDESAMLENKLRYVIQPQNATGNDIGFQLLNGAGDLSSKYPLKKQGNHFVLEFDINKGGYVMEDVTVAVYRKTAMGNTVIRFKSFNAASNNF